MSRQKHELHGGHNWASFDTCAILVRLSFLAMSAVEIAKLYKNLSLADEDEAILEMFEEAREEGIKEVDRTAKWLAEQIGEVVEIPSESKECWGNFLRVKVRIEIFKPLKRWLRLKLGKSDEITMVSLKYERLPEFYYAYGRIGHGIKECLDMEAGKVALDDSPTKYGSWLNATISEKQKNIYNPQRNWSSSDRARSSGTSHETEGDGSVSLNFVNMVPKKVVLMSPMIAMRKLINEKQKETLEPRG
ncbi:hypothetical protein Ddye_026472 [Dipteronia dyeriana]|uniref:Zinc knuckle CX2CX4HX4C domain-containing protein n=1 Tax=Dipteronia dyeriana TaxID=168575 RepID=A0AAD9TM88_9ROSI|nr:hypothetical protein Ddye_026472 [Dipteronia dyeriana]